jgi:FtsH-binding integral membrane protein
MSATCIVFWGVIVAVLVGLLFTRRRYRNRRGRLACSLVFMGFMFYSLIGTVYVFSERLADLPDEHSITGLDSGDVLDVALWPYRLVTE